VYWNAPSVSAWFMARNLLWQQHEGQKTRITVDGIVVNRKKEILMEKRQIEPFKGCWVLPGGHVEFGETVENALRREIKEELGVRFFILSFMGVEQEMYKRKGIMSHEINFVFLGRIAKTHVQSLEDEYEFQWVSLAEFSQRTVLPKLLVSHVARWLKNRKTFWAMSS